MFAVASIVSELFENNRCYYAQLSGRKICSGEKQMDFYTIFIVTEHIHTQKPAS